MTSTKTQTQAVDTEDGAVRVGPMHQAFADFLNSQHGAGGITAEQVFLVTSKRKGVPQHRRLPGRSEGRPGAGQGRR